MGVEVLASLYLYSRQSAKASRHSGAEVQVDTTHLLFCICGAVNLNCFEASKTRKTQVLYAGLHSLPGCAEARNPSAHAIEHVRAVPRGGWFHRMMNNQPACYRSTSCPNNAANRFVQIVPNRCHDIRNQFRPFRRHCSMRILLSSASIARIARGHHGCPVLL